MMVDQAAPHPQISFVAYSAEHLVEEEVHDLARLTEVIGNYPVCWVSVVGLGDEATLRALAAVFKLHPLALEDVVHVHQRAKVEAYGEQLFIIARPVATTQYMETEQLSLFLGKGFVLTFQERPSALLTPIAERLRAARAGIRNAGPDYLAYAILDAAVDSYFPAMDAVSERLDALEDELSQRTAHKAMARIHAVRSDQLLMRRAIWPHRDALAMLARDPGPLISDETRIFLRDCYDHTVQIIDLLETYREMCSDLRDYWVSIVSTRMNEVMKWLTIIATIFIPLTFIVGLYGMNFDPNVSPWNMPELRWRWGYPAVLALMAAVAGGMLLLFRRRGWLGTSWVAPPIEPADPADSADPAARSGGAL